MLRMRPRVTARADARVILNGESEGAQQHATPLPYEVSALECALRKAAFYAAKIARPASAAASALSSVSLASARL